MTLSYAIKEAQAIQQRLDDFVDAALAHPLEDPVLNKYLILSMGEAAGLVADFIKHKNKVTERQKRLQIPR